MSRQNDIDSSNCSVVLILVLDCPMPDLADRSNSKSIERLPHGMPVFVAYIVLNPPQLQRDVVRQQT